VVVDRHQGQIIIDSVMGKGTTVSIRIPADLSAVSNRNGSVTL
jgi:signal transduction histidine kinase